MSTIVFVFQAALGLAMFVETRDVLGSAAVVGTVTIMILMGLTSRYATDNLSGALVCGLCGTIVVIIATQSWLFGTGLAVAVALLAVAVTSCIAEETTDAADPNKNERWLLLYVAALPLGIGTVVGGSILLWRRLYATANVPFA